jgi:hypothetical protein
MRMSPWKPWSTAFLVGLTVLGGMSLPGCDSSDGNPPVGSISTPRGKASEPGVEESKGKAKKGTPNR